MWGAEAYASASSGGLGGYAIGNKDLIINNNIYICCGQAGYHQTSPFTGSAYNGGGAGQSCGGGCTHIATTNRGELYNYVKYQTEVLLVAGGGGGSDYGSGNGGYGGGTNGTNSIKNEHVDVGGLGGTQSAGGTGGNNGSFGRGGAAKIDGSDAGGGGGGGWYGGGGSTTASNAGGGGSGHIGAVTNGSMKTGIWGGSGKALITWMPVL